MPDLKRLQESAKKVQTKFRPETGPVLPSFETLGIHKGKITEISGIERSGKTLLILTLLTEAQTAGLTCSYIDADYSFSIQAARARGVDSSLLVYAPRNGEEAFDVAEYLAKNSDLLIIDSLGSLRPRKSVDQGTDTRLAAQGLWGLESVGSSTFMLFTNQVRSDLRSRGYPTSAAYEKVVAAAATTRMTVSRPDIRSGDEILTITLKKCGVRLPCVTYIITIPRLTTGDLNGIPL